MKYRYLIFLVLFNPSILSAQIINIDRENSQDSITKRWEISTLIDFSSGKHVKNLLDLSIKSSLLRKYSNRFALNFIVNNDIMQIESNNVSRFYISGTTNTEIINLWAGDSRVDASNLTAQNISVFHRASNDIIVRPIQSITGKMVSTGNIILKNNPPIVDVQQLYQGHVIYN